MSSTSPKTRPDMSKPRVLFVCTHNSRRSQFAHVWAEVFAHHYGLDWVRCYSGGTEVTACDERTVAALRRAGFQVSASGAAPNPIYQCKYSDVFPSALVAVAVKAVPVEVATGNVTAKSTSPDPSVVTEVEPR